MKYLKYYFLAIIGLFQSCDLTDEPPITGTPVQKMAGEWFLQLYDDTGTILYVDYSMCTTSNTSANSSNKMWFLDHSHWWGTQNLMTVDIANLSFSADDDNIEFDDSHNMPGGKPVVALGTLKSFTSGTPQKMKIIDGKIMQNAAFPPSGVTTDSMYMVMTGVYALYEYMADSYSINGSDTTVVWKLSNVGTENDGPYVIKGYRRTGFLEDEH